MNQIKLGILREGKVPPDKRVPLTPDQCVKVMEDYPGLEVVVQPSPIRSITNEEYIKLGITLQEHLSDCDIIMGVKEVNISDLIENKQFLFFSHTVKKQSYNRDLLRAILDKKIQLTDYEVLKNENRKRITGFGRFAGIVGAYNSFYAFGLKTGLYSLKRANECFDREELENELKKVILPKNTKICLTGVGKVGYGAQEIIDLLPLKEVTPEAYLNERFDSPVYTHLRSADYYSTIEKESFDKAGFYANPSEYKSILSRYIETTDIYLACHFWSQKSPKLLSQVELQKAKNLKIIGDISCDIADPIASTLRPSTIASPLYGYDPIAHKEVDFMTEGAITVMAVDNLPCELPREASEDFGKQLIKNVFPHLFTGDKDGVIDRGSETTKEGKLNQHYSFLQDYVDGK
jgi:saccharopine dehydrogenase (NAD+, L-lysine-forming)